MTSARTKILRHLWETGGGFINQYGNVYLVTKVALCDANIQVNTNPMTIEKTVHKGENVAVIRGLVVTRGRGYLYKVLMGVCIDNRYYEIIKAFPQSMRTSSGTILDSYTISLREIYTDKK